MASKGFGRPLTKSPQSTQNGDTDLSPPAAGDRVVLQNLQAIPELNGRMATLIAYDLEKERWQTQIDGDSTPRFIKTSNFSRCEVVPLKVEKVGVTAHKQAPPKKAKDPAPKAAPPKAKAPAPQAQPGEGAGKSQTKVKLERKATSATASQPASVPGAVPAVASSVGTVVPAAKRQKPASVAGAVSAVASFAGMAVPSAKRQKTGKPASPQKMTKAVPVCEGLVDVAPRVPPTRKAVTAKTKAAAPAIDKTCVCGNVLRKQDGFCPKCGAKRPEAKKPDAKPEEVADAPQGWGGVEASKAGRRPVEYVKKVKTGPDGLAPVALLLRRLSAAGELVKAGSKHVGDVMLEATGDELEASCPAFASASAAAVAAGGADEPMDGGEEGGAIRKKRKRGFASALFDIDDGPLAEEEEELEDEEEVIGDSDEEAPEAGEDLDADVADNESNSCTCGAVFGLEAVFCGKCGQKRSAKTGWPILGAPSWAEDSWGGAAGSSASKRKAPGDEGFSAYASEVLKKAGLHMSSSPFAGLSMRLHQELASFLVGSPQSPVTRLLVDHAPGSGKTRIMLSILDCFFDDPRPKIALFPSDRAADNFYQELFKWPTRWRTYFAHCRQEEAALLSGAVNWKRRLADVWDLGNEKVRGEAKRKGIDVGALVRQFLDIAREVLEMKPAVRGGKIRPKVAARFRQENPGVPVPRSPLRTYRYATAGGCASDLREDGLPKSSLLRVGFDSQEKNPFSGKVIFAEDSHVLVRANKAAARLEKPLTRLRDQLHTARRAVLVAFTGAFLGNDASEGRRLLDVVKGAEAINGQRCDEGFISSFQIRGSPDFPTEVPRSLSRLPDGFLDNGMLPELIKEHSLHGEALKRYVLKEMDFQLIPRLSHLPDENKQRNLANFCNLHVHTLAYNTSNHGHRDALLKDTKEYAPKFYAIAKAIAKRNEKAVVMLSRDTGYKCLLEVLQKAGKQGGFRIATLEERVEFNDPRKNLRGERFRVLVVDTSQDAISIFTHVRKLYFADVPARLNDFVQRVQRCLRFRGHCELPEQKRTFGVEVHVAQLPKFMKQGPGALVYRELMHAKDTATTPGRLLEAATSAICEEFKQRKVKTLADLQRDLQAEDGEKLIELIVETALEHLCETNKAPAKPLAMALQRLRKGGDDLDRLEQALTTALTADELLLAALVTKSAEVDPIMESIRGAASDRPLLLAAYAQPLTNAPSPGQPGQVEPKGEPRGKPKGEVQTAEADRSDAEVDDEADNGLDDDELEAMADLEELEAEEQQQAEAANGALSEEDGSDEEADDAASEDVD